MIKHAISHVDHGLTEAQLRYIFDQCADRNAFFIATIGCLEGFKVEGSAESVGAHTTSSVVQSIFVVIVLDALVAMFCMEIGW